MVCPVVFAGGVFQKKTSCGEPKIMEMLDKPVDFVLFQLYPVEGWVYQSVVNKFIRENKNPSFSPPWKKTYRHISPSYFGWFAKHT